MDRDAAHRSARRAGTLVAGTLALFSGLALPAGEARADDGELPIAVLTIQTFDAFEQADALTNAMKRAVDASPGWSTAQLDKDYALLVLVDGLGCNDPPDAACEEKIAAEIKVDRFVWGQMKLAGAEVVGDLHYWVKGAGSKSINFHYSANLKTAADDTLVQLAAKQFADLSGGAPGGHVDLKVGKVDGAVFVDGKEAGKVVKGVGSLELPLGAHTIVVKARGYEDMETKVEIKPRASETVSLTPIVVTPGPPYQKIFGVTAIGLGAVAAGVATYAGVRVLSINSDLEPYVKGTDPDFQFAKGKDGCDPNADYENIQVKSNPVNDDKLFAIQDSCQEASTMQTMTLAMWPVAGTLAGVGVILLATADWSDGPTEAAALPVEIVPMFGPEGAFVSVSKRF